MIELTVSVSPSRRGLYNKEEKAASAPASVNDKIVSMLVTEKVELIIHILVILAFQILLIQVLLVDRMV